MSCTFNLVNFEAILEFGRECDILNFILKGSVYGHCVVSMVTWYPLSANSYPDQVDFHYILCNVIDIA